VIPPCCRQVEIDMRVHLWPARGTCRFGRQQRCDREVAVDMLPRCRRGSGVAGAARRDHDDYSEAPGPSYPTVALFHVSLTLRESLKRAAESPTSRSACLLSHTGSGRLLGGLQGGAHINAQPRPEIAQTQSRNTESQGRRSRALDADTEAAPAGAQPERGRLLNRRTRRAPPSSPPHTHPPPPRPRL